MPIGQTIAQNILISLGLADPGATSFAASDVVDTLSEVNVMLDAWVADETLIQSVGVASYALTGAKNPYTIGSGGDFDAVRPSKIAKATIIATVGSGANRNEVRLIPADEYFDHNDLSASATGADVLYYDNDASGTTGGGLAKIYLYPVPSCPTVTTLELVTEQQIGPLILATNTPMQQAVQDAIQYNGAWRMITRFGISDATLIQKIGQLAQRSEDRLRKQVARVRMLPPGAVPAETPAAAK